MKDPRQVGQSFFKSLMERRVPHITGMYLGTAWAVIQFIIWLESRYNLSPYITDLSFVTLLSLLPSIIIIAYYHGRPGRDRWSKVELITIPTNLLGSLILVISIFYGKDLGATTKTVTVENENGEQIQRQVANAVFMKKIILFNFNNKTGQEQLDWLISGMPAGVSADLGQNIFVEYIDPFFLGLHTQIKQTGYVPGQQLPFSLMQKLTRDYYYQYFLTGNIDQQTDKTGKPVYQIQAQLYDATNGELVSENHYRHSNIFQIIDDISVMLKNEMDIPDAKFQKDLPASEILSVKESTYQIWVQGRESVLYDNDYDKGIKQLEEVIAIDPGFALANYYLGRFYANNNQITRSLSAISAALKHQYKLSEWTKFRLKRMYYSIKGESDKSFALLKMQVEIYPEDITAREQLAEAYFNYGEYDHALTQYSELQKRIAEPQSYLDMISDVYIRKNNLQKALSHVREYVEFYPQQAYGLMKLAYVYELLGDRKKAWFYYEKAAILEPQNIPALLKMADYQLYQLNYGQALKEYEQALAFAAIDSDRIRVYRELAEYFDILGQPQKALEYIKLLQQTVHISQTKLNGFFIDISYLGFYVKAGEVQQARDILKTVTNELKSPFDVLSTLGYLIFYISMQENNQNLSVWLLELEQELGKLDPGTKRTLNDYLPILRIQVADLQGDYKKAAVLLAEFIHSPRGIDYRIIPLVVSVYRKTGQLDKAEEYLLSALAGRPYYAVIHYELALVYAQKNDQSKAREHLGRALDIWKNAEVGFKKSRLAQEKYQQLKNN